MSKKDLKCIVPFSKSAIEENFGPLFEVIVLYNALPSKALLKSFNQLYKVIVIAVDLVERDLNVIYTCVLRSNRGTVISSCYFLNI